MHFVSCDWGTSTFRLKVVGGLGTGELRTADGVALLAAGAGGDRAGRFRAALASGLEAIRAAAGLPVVISGMASSSIGWKELPYATLPFNLDGADAVWERLDDRIHLVSGLRSDTDILRGEETQALGLAAALGKRLPARAIFILPGTHSKHLDVDRGRVVGFRTYMTGELFDLLTRQSVLRHSTEPAADFNPEAFREGVDESQREPLTSALFRVRTRQVLDRHDPRSNTSFLSGLLIGAELARLARSDRPVIVAAGEPLRNAYTTAGAILGLGPGLQTLDSDPLAALGQEILLRRLLGGK